MRGWIAVVVASVACCSCTPLHVVSVLPLRGASHEDAFSTRLAVVTDTRSVHLPLVVNGSSVALSDVARALELAARSEAEPVLGARARERRFELFIELVEVHAEYSSGEVVVELTVRATLRDRAGNAHLGQTYARARVARVTTPDRGGPEVAAQACANVAARLAGWLAGLELDRA